MVRKRISTVILLSCCFVSSTLAQDFDAINLLTTEQTTLVKEQSSIEGLDELPIRDNDESTFVKLHARKDEPIELVYHFGGETVAPQAFKIQTKDLEANQAQIEVLVSMLSATSGYRSLRLEPLRASKAYASTVTFDRVAAKWVMIKITPFDKDTVVAVLELSLLGKVGPPESVYKFDESPAEAIEVIEKLKGSVDVTISPDEVALFKDAANGKLDEISFAEAALISSGVIDKQQRQSLLAQIDQLEASLKKQIPASLPAFERGKRILALLHQTTFTAGYESQQTDVSTVLESKQFNCVSSATLYNIMARRMGLDARGIEVPDHAFSILYDGTTHADIETTSPRGFNPARDRAALGEIERQTGFVYIPDRQRSKRREISVVGMIALTYYNHGVGQAESKDYQAALVSYFKALSLDPKNKSAVKNVLATIANWSAQLCDDGDLDKASSVLAIGLELAPDHYSIIQNHKYVWQTKASLALKEDKLDQAIAHFATAYEETKNSEFLRRQSWAYLQQAGKQVDAGNWDAAIKIGAEGLAKVDQSVKWEIERWMQDVFMAWSHAELDKTNFAEAIDILERGLRETDRNFRLSKQIAFLVQEWGTHVNETEGDEAGLALVAKLSKRFPKIASVQAVASSYTTRRANALIEAGDFKAAVEAYAEARKVRPDDYRLKQSEERLWIQWGMKHIDAREWQKALDVYKKGRVARPDAYNLQKNIVYIVQEWSREVVAKDGIVAAEKLVAEQAVLFSDVQGVKDMRGTHVFHAAQELLNEKKYEDAEALLLEHRELDCVRYKFNQHASNVYRQKANEDIANKRWENAIAIFEKGLKNHPDATGIQKNLTFSWDSWARESMDKEEWQAAIDIYEKGLESMPNNYHLKKNMDYCKSKMK